MKARFITPAVTAMNRDGTPDHEGNRRLYEHLIAGGIDGILILGSIGEFFAFTEEQKRQIIDNAAAVIGSRTELYVGTGGMRLCDTIALSNYAWERGIKNVMAISPFYFSLSPESIESYYDALADGTSASIYLYDFPARTGYAIPPQTTLNLLRRHDNIVGYKDSIAGMDHTRALLETVLPEFPEFRVYSGFDENLIHNVMAGGSGCIGGMSNIFPELCSRWASAVTEGDAETMALCQRKMDSLMALYEVCTPFISAIKKAVVLRGVGIQEYASAPFLPATDFQTEKIREIMETAL